MVCHLQEVEGVGFDAYGGAIVDFGLVDELVYLFFRIVRDIGDGDCYEEEDKEDN
jgi:hypothetical protein